MFQDRSNSYDTMKFTNFENQLLDIMRTTNNMTIDPTEQLKGTAIVKFFNWKQKLLLKSPSNWPYSSRVRPQYIHIDGVANSEDPDQTAPLQAV